MRIKDKNPSKKIKDKKFKNKIKIKIKKKRRLEGTNSRNCLLKFNGQCSIVENIYIIVCVPTNDSTCEKKNYSAKKKRLGLIQQQNIYIYIYILGLKGI